MNRSYVSPRRVAARPRGDGLDAAVRLAAEYYGIFDEIHAMPVESLDSPGVCRSGKNVERARFVRTDRTERIANRGVHMVAWVCRCAGPAE